MMTLSEIFEHLNYGEFAQMPLGGNGEDGIDSEDYAQVVSYLNMGLIELYKRFALRESECIIQMYADINTYELKSKFATVGGTEPILYILDTVANPFSGRVLRINSITSSNENVNLVINDRSITENQLIVPTHNTFTLSDPDPAHTLSVLFREGPEKVVAAGLDPSAVEIPLPESLLEPLLYYMAARANAEVLNSDGNAGGASGVYMGKFLASILQVKRDGLVENHHLRNERLEDNGWP